MSVVVPDSIEPAIGWRSWKLNDDGLLESQHTGRPWTPGEKLEADCRVNSYLGSPMMKYTVYRWSVCTGESMTLEEAQRHYMSVAQMFGVHVPAPPPIALPHGCGYVLETVTDEPGTHTPPDEHCTCGIYAVRTLDDALLGDVIGKVALWGKVVPGDKGWRAQYAYPVELFVRSIKKRGWLRQHHVSAEVPDTLLAYGVPLRGLENVQVAA